MLDHALDYPNVLFCMDNETSGEEAWAVYWSELIHNRAQKEGKKVNVTEMWDDWDLPSKVHRRTLDHPERFEFADVSQNNHQTDQTHWAKFQWVYNYISDEPRPVNNVKIYGADRGPHGGDNRDAIEKFWRLIFGGAASARFHRPESGIGLSGLAQTQLQSARMFLDEFNLFESIPDSKHQYLSGREEDEAYLTYIEGKQYAVFFTNGGEVNLQLPDSGDAWQIRWLDISKKIWTQGQTVSGKKEVQLSPSGEGLWVALLTKE